MPSGERPNRRRFLSVAGAGAVAAGLLGGGIAEARSSGHPDKERTPVSGSATHPKSAPRPLYLGTYTSQSGGGKGIGLAAYDARSGHLAATGTLTGVADPSFLAL